VANITVKPATKGLKGEIVVPGDKSISHRAVILGSLAEGVTEVEGFLRSLDCLNTLRAFRQMGISVEDDSGGRLVIHGRGLYGLSEPEDVLDAGNSGTMTRLMLGVLSGCKFYSCITGDESVRRRPMGRVVEPLRQMGAMIYGRQGGKLAPLSISGGNLHPISYRSPVASAQVKSAILLAGLFADGKTEVEEPSPSRDHTERMLRCFGAEVVSEKGQIKPHPYSAKVAGRPYLRGRKVAVPGDISSASFFIVAGVIVPDSHLVVKNVGVNPTRTGIIDILTEMGGRIKLSNRREVSGEPVADIEVETSELHGVEIGGDLIPRAIDEFPIIAVAGAFAKGDTIIRDAKELRVKESDRIATMAATLRKMGVGAVEEAGDGMRIRGGNRLKGATCDSFGDHRIAMSALIAGLVAEGETMVANTECIDTSFPNFRALLGSLFR
jgi:3-phosphoshikimate 1-carboxyvinyltransferase